jgi:hypothetical protein
MFGFAVAASRDTIVAGAPNHSGNGTRAGAAYVFERRGDEWRQAAKLVPSDSAPEMLCGNTVAVSGDGDDSYRGMAGGERRRRLERDLEEVPVAAAARRERDRGDRGPTRRRGHLDPARLRSRDVRGQGDLEAPLRLLSRGPHDAVGIDRHLDRRNRPDRTADLSLGLVAEAPDDVSPEKQRDTSHPEPRDGARQLLQASDLAGGPAREESYLAQAVQKDPSFALARVRRARLALETNAWAALADLEAALQVKSGDPDVLAGPDKLEASRLAARAAVHAFLRRTPAWLVGFALDDLVGETDAVNLPGVGPDKYPSWTRKQSMTLEEIRESAAVRYALGVERASFAANGVEDKA